MIDRLANQDHDPRPLTATGLIRLLVGAVTIVAVQVAVIDPITTPILGHVDLPLTVAAVLVLARPTHSVSIGLVFGLMVDASAHRLFGLHTVAFATLGPAAVLVPTPAWRRRGLLITWRTGTQALVAATVIAAGRAVAAGHISPDMGPPVLRTALLVGLLALPVSRVVGLDAPLGRRRVGWRTLPPRSVAGPRPGPIRPLGP